MSTTAALPIRELIAENLVDTINSVSDRDGYNYTLSATRPDRLGEATGDGVVVVDFGDGQILDDQNCQMVDWIQEFRFLVYAVQAEGSTEPYDRQNALIEADIHKAVQVDPYRSGLAIDTFAQPPEQFQRAAGDHEGIVARVFCRFRHQLGDPYTLR